ncbi:MAG: CpsD/CapB family tyrosine-protein kinase [Vicinamibacterales bacterium]
MSRIQQILDKAERDGSVRRLRADATFAAGLGPDTAGAPNGPIGSPLMTAEPAAHVAGAGSAQPRFTTARVVTGVRLDPRLVTAAFADGVATEQYRALRTRILHADPISPVNVVLVTSPGRGEGKTLTAANLGLAMAQEWQRRVCVIDADLRHPQMQRIFGLPDGPGLCDVLTGHASLDEALVTLEDHQLTVLPAGNLPAARPAELLGTGAMRRTLDTLRSQFDRLVVDTAPALPLADVSVLAPLVDRVLLVVRAGITGKPSIHDAVSSIDRAKLLGLVLNEAV